MSIGSKFRGLKRNLAATKQGMNQADKGSRKQYKKDVAADVGMGAADAAIMYTPYGQIYTAATGKTFSDSIGYESKTALGNSIDVATDTAASTMAVTAPIAAGITVGVATGNPMLGVQTYQGVRGAQKMTGAYDQGEGNNSLINMEQADQALGFVDAGASMVGGMGSMGGGTPKVGEIGNAVDDSSSYGKKGNPYPEGEGVTQMAAYGGWLDNYTPQRMMQNGGKMPDISSVKYSNESDGEFDLSLLKKGLSHVESSDGTDMMNPESSATGNYGQLFNLIKDMPELKGVTREQFAEDLELQDEIFQMRYDGRLEPGTRTGIRDSVQDLRKKYDSQLKAEEINDVELGALINFLGRDGSRQYLGYHVRDGRPLEDVFPKKFGPGAEQANKTPKEYIEKFREVYKNGGRIKKKSKSRVNEAGNYTKPTMRKGIFQRIKAGTKGGNAGQWSARKAQMLAKAYRAAGGGYTS
jgi:hypothetical protein